MTPTLKRRDVSSTDPWTAAWSAAAAVVVAAAGLLATLIGVARRIADQGSEIEHAVTGAGRNTAPLFDVAAVNRKLERVAQGLGGGTA